MKKRFAADREDSVDANNSSRRAPETFTINSVGRDKKGCTICVRRFFISISIIYCFALVAFKYSRVVQDAVIYLHWIRTPYFRNLSNPSEYGAERSRNLHIPVPNGSYLGVWQMAPSVSYLPERVSTDEEFDAVLGNGMPIVLYLHGNLGTRGTYHRVDLYKVLASLGYHVVALDYAGFGDSPGWPTEKGMATDARVVWEWLKAQAGDNRRMYVWGHSLGSAAATLFVKRLCQEGEEPDGVVLEAPLTNVADAGMSHPFAIPFRYLPFFRSIFLEPLPEKFDSLSRVGSLSCPLLIVHGLLDMVIPIDQGKRIYKAAVSGTSDPSQVYFEVFPEAGHKQIKSSPKLRSVLWQFIPPASER